MEDTPENDERRFRHLVEGSAHGILVHGNGKPLFANRRLTEIFGYDSPAEILALETIMGLAAPHERDRLSRIVDALVRGEEGASHYEYQGRRRDGALIWLDNVARTLTWGDEPAVQVSVVDTTARRTVEEALRQEQRFNRAILDTIDSLVVVLDRDGRIVHFNHASETATGYRAEEVEGRLIWDVLIPQENIDSVRQVFHSLSAGRFPNRHENEWVGKDGTRRLVSWSNTATVNDHGDVAFVIGTGVDITEQRALQEQLLQAQKMEAVGQLTGGIAHDFNNLLTAIIGNLELLEIWHAGDQRSEQAIGQAQEAAELGAELTGRLLAFARRQPLDPKVISLSDIVLDIGELLARTLGETIEISMVLGNPLDRAFADPSQVRNALLNLAINGRDAMPDGGHLTIETANVELDEAYARDHAEVIAGDYVMLSVTDTGSGIAPEIRDRVFEPFFTTKDVGIGSGMGLSMVYGFIKQSGGHVRLYSEVGHGTTVSLYLPKTEDPDRARTVSGVPAEMPLARQETVLVVEDDVRVRRITVERLETLGYSVLEAENGQAAVDLLKGAPSVDLVFTDVVMPGGMSGTDLAREVERLRPGVKVLLTSGYSAHAGIENGKAEDGMPWLRKPYRLAELARKVRDVLEA